MSKRKGGRPSAYEKFIKPNLSKIEEWAASGLTDEDIAKNIGIAVGIVKSHIEIKKKALVSVPFAF